MTPYLFNTRDCELRDQVVHLEVLLCEMHTLKKKPAIEYYNHELIVRHQTGYLWLLQCKMHSVVALYYLSLGYMC